MHHFLWIVPLLLLIFFLSSPRLRGDIAESRVRRLLASGLESNRYTVFNDLLLADAGGTRQIDHLVVSKFGIFVIESRYVRGWISGAEFQERWKQKSLWQRSQFDNPLHSNRLQVEMLQRLLDYPAQVFHPVVVLVGHKGARTRLPENVVAPDKLLALLHRKSTQLLDAEQAEHAIRAIDRARLTGSGARGLKPRALARLLLLLALIVGACLAFRDDIESWIAAARMQTERRSEPEQFRADGSRKSERELWEDRLVCAYSADTGRCACYDRDGQPVDLELETCRSLAEKGSVLKQ